MSPESRSVWLIVGPYLLFGAAWIFFSDWLVAHLFTDPDAARAAQTVKGWTFVAASAALVGILARRLFEEQASALRDLEGTRNDLDLYAVHLTRLQERERRRLARELHDELGEGLAGLRLLLAQVEGVLEQEDGRARELVREGEDLLAELGRKARDLTGSLRPAVLDALGPLEAIEWLAERFRDRTGLPCDVSLPGDRPRLDDESSTHVFRIVQEALRNVRRHAGASRAWVEMTALDGRWRLEVRDDGRGPEGDGSGEPRGREPSFGIIGMKERAKILGGGLEVLAPAEGGTVVRLEFPRERSGAEPVS